ncbi:MAG: hypothetical protein JJU44_10480 [Planctomycetes bacterium]|nr:hypothetical protein [Planctomycetota bacterium]
MISRFDTRTFASRHRPLTSAGDAFRRFLLVGLGVVAACLVYSSLNAGLWSQYRRGVEQYWNGTTALADLDRLAQDRMLAWVEIGYFYDFYKYFHAPLIDYPFGLTGTAEMGELWLVMLTAAALLFLGCHAVVFLVQWRCVRRRLPGLDPAFFRLPEIRRARRRIVERAFVVLLCVLPVAGGLSWYVFYDRLQSSFDRPNGTTRWARYLYQSFSPRTEDWVFIGLCTLAAVAWYAWCASRKLVRSLSPELIAPFHRLCSGCGYPLADVSGRCPECGLPKGEPLRPEGRLTPRRVVLGVAILAVIVATAWVFTVRIKHGGYPYQFVRHWLTMRGDTRKHYPDLYLVPNRPVMLRWDGVDVWIVVQHREYGAWPARPDTYYTDLPVLVCKVGQGPAVVIEPMLIRHEKPYRLVVGRQEALKLELSGGAVSPIIGLQTWLYTMPVVSPPEEVQGFGLGEPLTPEAEAFLEEVRVMVGEPAAHGAD